MFADLLALTFTAGPDLAIDIVEIAPTVRAGIAACNAHRPDIVLLDLGLPDGSGVEVAEHVAATLPDAKVVIVSGRSDTDPTRGGIEQLSHGSVHKRDGFDALQTMLAGLIQTAGGQTARLPAGRRRLDSILSKREREVFALIGQRLSSRDVAERLGISLHTVNAHRKNIARKLAIRGANLAFVAYEYRRQPPRQR